MRTMVAVLLLMAPALAFAQVNKCIDAKGKVVGYGSDCPAGSRAEKMDIQKGPPPSETKQKSAAERDADFRKRQTEQKETATKAEKKATETAENKRACEDARGYLKALQDKQRIPRTDPKTGERAYLADSEYAGEIARSQQMIATNCK